MVQCARRADGSLIVHRVLGLRFSRSVGFSPLRATSCTGGAATSKTSSPTPRTWPIAVGVEGSGVGMGRVRSSFQFYLRAVVFNLVRTSVSQDVARK